MGVPCRRAQALPVPIARSTNLYGIAHPFGRGLAVSKLAAIGTLPLASGALGTGVHSTRMIIEIVHYHFRRDKTMRQLCDALNMRRSSVKRRLKKIEAYLYQLENVASAKAEHAMSAVGVVK